MQINATAYHPILQQIWNHSAAT